MFSCLKKPRVANESLLRANGDTFQDAVSASAAEHQHVECLGFADLPPHVMETLMYHVLQLGDVDAVRSCRLVCKPWHKAVAVNVTAAFLRPMTRSAQDINQFGQPIINYEADGLRAPDRKSYASMTIEVLESSFRVGVPQPQPELQECEQPVTVEDARQAEKSAQALWSRMQETTSQQNLAAFHDSIGHYPVEDSSYVGSFSNVDEDDEHDDQDEEERDSSGTVTSTLAANAEGSMSQATEESSAYVASIAHCSSVSASIQAVGNKSYSVNKRRWLSGMRGSSLSGEGPLERMPPDAQKAQEHAPRLRWLRHPRNASLADQANQLPTALGVSQEEGSGEGEPVDIVRGGSSRRRGRWLRHTRGGSDLSDDTRASNFQELEESYASYEGKNAGRPDVSSSHAPFPRLGGWLRSVRGHSPDADAETQSNSLAGISSANLRSALQSADGAVITVHNEELDNFAKELRQQFIEGEHELPTMVLQVGVDGAELGTSDDASARDRAAGAPPIESERSRIGRLRQLVSRGHHHAGEPVPSISAAGTEVVTGASDTDAEVPATTHDAPAEDGPELDQRQKQVLQFLSRFEEQGDAVLKDIPVTDCKPETSEVEIAAYDDIHRYPTQRCLFMMRATEQPAASKHRRQIITPTYHFTSTCHVDLVPLKQFKRLQVLGLPLATNSVNPADLAELTQLTSLTISMRRRNHLGLGKRLQTKSQHVQVDRICLGLFLNPTFRYLPPPAHFNGIWQAIAQLQQLRSLNLSHSVGMSDRQISTITALTSLECLDLTGVQLPVSTLRTFACLTSLTQLRIPNVTIVSERFLQLMGEGRDAPRLAEMLEAMPQLRHLDLYCVQHGENQTSLKDPKHMRTLARATQLQRLDIAKLGQVTDSALALLQDLTAITALKLGCNTFELYRLSGRAFVMFRTWEHLRVLYLEACRFLQKDAYIALACSCPHLQVLHMDTASRITPAAFALTHMMPELRVLELVAMKLVPNRKIVDVCAGMHHLRPGMADHIIALKKCGGDNLGKFGEQVRGGVLGKLLPT